MSRRPKRLISEGFSWRTPSIFSLRRCAFAFFQETHENKRKVLFLCTGNSCRSQMAEGLTHHVLGQLFQIDALLRKKLKGSGLEDYIQIIATVDNDCENQLIRRLVL